LLDVATLIGYNIVSRPFFAENSPLMSRPHSERLEEYYKTGRMLVKMAEAIGRISLAGRELARLSGYTERVTQLIKVLDDLNKGVYQRTMVENKQKSLDGANSSGNPPKDLSNLKPGNGKIIYTDHLIK
jgi:ATP-binding cassette, subfamily D (ALD), member 3